jgi:hypothetical protein
VTYWGGPGYSDEPVDPNPVGPPPGWTTGSAAPSAPAYGYPPPPGWAGYGSPGDRRPATATIAAVLGAVLGGLIVLEGFLLLVGASVVDSIERSLDQSSGVPASLIVNGLLDLVVGGGLTAGSALLLRRRPAGRLLLAAGNVVALGQSVYWTAVSDVGAVAVTVLHAALAVLGLALVFTVSASTWLRAGQPSG